MIFTLLISDKQASIFDNIMCVVASQLGGVYFLYGYGGTGKTFMWKTLSSAVRSNGYCILCCQILKCINKHYINLLCITIRKIKN